MRGYIDGINFHELEAERYWSFPKSYKGDVKEETRKFVLSNEFLCGCKQDGHYARLIKDEDGSIILQGRSKSVSGEYLDKHEWVPQLNKFFDWLPNGTCLLGELYFPSQRGSRRVTTILGCLLDKAIARQESGEKLHYYIFDIWAWNGKSFLKTTAQKRFDLIKKIEDFDCVDKAVYYKGEEAWEQLNNILSRGGEGMVLTRADSYPEPGKRTARKTLKVKMSIDQTIDAFIDGDYKQPTKTYTGKMISEWNYWLNLKTNEKVNDNMYLEYSQGKPWEPITKNYYYGRAAAVSISVMKDGKPFHIGYISGINDEMRDGIVNNPKEWIGKVYEVSAMEIEHIEGSYSLRHGKFVKPRPDKTIADCEFSQISE